MKRATVNFIVDLISFCALLGLAITGSIMKWILPPGSAGHGYGFRGGREAGGSNLASYPIGREKAAGGDRVSFVSSISKQDKIQ